MADRQADGGGEGSFCTTPSLPRLSLLSFSLSSFFSLSVSRARALSHLHTNAHIHTHARTNTHTHTHTLSLSFSLSLSPSLSLIAGAGIAGAKAGVLALGRCYGQVTSCSTTPSSTTSSATPSASRSLENCCCGTKLLLRNKRARGTKLSWNKRATGTLLLRNKGSRAACSPCSCCGHVTPCFRALSLLGWLLGSLFVLSPFHAPVRPPASHHRHGHKMKQGCGVWWWGWCVRVDNFKGAREREETLWRGVQVAQRPGARGAWGQGGEAWSAKSQPKPKNAAQTLSKDVHLYM